MRILVKKAIIFIIFYKMLEHMENIQYFSCRPVHNGFTTEHIMNACFFYVRNFIDKWNQFHKKFNVLMDHSHAELHAAGKQPILFVDFIPAVNKNFVISGAGLTAGGTPFIIDQDW